MSRTLNTLTALGMLAVLFALMPMRYAVAIVCLVAGVRLSGFSLRRRHVDEIGRLIEDP